MPLLSLLAYRMYLNCSCFGTGLQALGAVFKSVGLLSTILLMYTVLQGSILLLMAIRLMELMSAQKRMAVITKTLRAVSLPWHIAQTAVTQAAVLCHLQFIASRLCWCCSSILHVFICRWLVLCQYLPILRYQCWSDESVWAPKEWI